MIFLQRAAAEEINKWNEKFRLVAPHFFPAAREPPCAAALPADVLAFEGVERKWLLLVCGILVPLLMKDARVVAAAQSWPICVCCSRLAPWSSLGSGESEELEFVDVNHLDSHVFAVLEKPEQSAWSSCKE